MQSSRHNTTLPLFEKRPIMELKQNTEIEWF
jgi:hypothetical protein